MSFGEVDTLGMLFEKLETLFDESQGYYESFLDTNNMYKAGKISDKDRKSTRLNSSHEQ